MSLVIKKLLILTIILILGIFLLGFSVENIETEQGWYLVTVKFPADVRVGRNTMTLQVIERNSKKPVNGLTIDVVPWMKAMEHGSTEIPVIKELGNGEYHVKKLNFSMPGEWEVYLRIKNNGKEDTAVFNVSVKK
jgi:hypothetical protein